MTILYKICFNIERDNEWSSPNRPIVNSIYDMVRVCLVSLVKQLSSEDNIVFFLDGEDQENVIEFICTEFNVNYKIYSFNYKCAAKINNEAILYIINSIEDENEIIYLCEDDYLHYNNCLQHIKDFLKQYPDYVCHPVDYPNLYTDKNNQTSEIILSKNWHWRSIKSTTYTIALTKRTFNFNHSIFTSINRSLFYDHIINLIYVFTKCFSPIPSLTSHIEPDCLPPCVNTENLFRNVYKKYREGEIGDRGNMSNKEWERLYAKGGYDGVGSGPGSLLKNNYKLINWLTEFIKKENINTMLDLGCGDMQWIPEVITNTAITYTGVDSVPDLILNHKIKYQILEFVCGDIISYNLKKQKYDLLFVKDVFQHLDNNRMKKFINNIVESDTTHSIIVVPHNINSDTREYFIKNKYKLIFEYQSDEIKHVFLK